MDPVSSCTPSAVQKKPTSSPSTPKDLSPHSSSRSHSYPPVGERLRGNNCWEMRPRGYKDRGGSVTIEAHELGRFERPVNSIAINLARSDPSHEGMPVVSVRWRLGEHIGLWRLCFFQLGNYDADRISGKFSERFDGPLWFHDMSQMKKQVCNSCSLIRGLSLFRLCEDRLMNSAQSLFLQQLLSHRDNPVRLETELLLKFHQRRRGAECVHADHPSFETDITLPSEG